MKEYKNNIYPRSLYITNDIEEAKKEFICPDGSQLEKDESARATVYRVNHKRKNRGDLLLLLNERPSVTLICHEALHITRSILEYLPCPLTDEAEECWAYLMGWVADCIQDYTKKRRSEPHG